MASTKILKFDDLQVGMAVLIVGKAERERDEADHENPMAAVHVAIANVVSQRDPIMSLKGRPLRITAMQLPFLAVRMAEFPRNPNSFALDARDWQFIRADEDYVAALVSREPVWWRRFFQRPCP